MFNKKTNIMVVNQRYIIHVASKILIKHIESTYGKIYVFGKYNVNNIVIYPMDYVKISCKDVFENGEN
jgi:hypothetical protein